MDTLIKNSINQIISADTFYKDAEKIKTCANILNKDKIIIVSGMLGTGKLNFIKNLLSLTGTINSFFYLNPVFDLNNTLTSSSILNKTFELYKRKYNDPKIIILEDINNIPGVKSFIASIHKTKKYKLIIIGNSIKITGIKELEITTPKLSNIKEANLNELINYGKLHDILLTQNINIKKRILSLNTNSIILKDIVGGFSVKNIVLLNLVITFLSKNNYGQSLRDLHKNLINIGIDISLITTIDYINYLLSSKMISRSYTYNLKTEKEITSKAKYYFTDNGIRNNIGLYSLNKDILIENFIFTELLSLGYKTYNGRNGTFDFTFYGIKENKNIFIHISKETDKNELKKEVRRLLKIPGDETKYLVVNNKQIEEMKIKKFVYENVKIVKLEELLKELN